MDGHPHYCQRCALEAWHITTEPHMMNRDEGPLPTVYNPLIQQLHRPGCEPLVDSVALFFVFILFISLSIHSPRNTTACIITLASHPLLLPLHYVLTTIVTFSRHCTSIKSHLALYCRLSIHWRWSWIGSKCLNFWPLTSIHVIPS